MLTGQHNYPNAIADGPTAPTISRASIPPFYGQDFGFQGGDDKDSTLARPALMEEAMRQYRNGAMVTLHLARRSAGPTMSRLLSATAFKGTFRISSGTSC